MPADNTIDISDEKEVHKPGANPKVDPICCSENVKSEAKQALLHLSKEDKHVLDDMEAHFVNIQHIVHDNHLKHQDAAKCNIQSWEEIEFFDYTKHTHETVPHHERHGWRYELGKFLESPNAQRVLMILLLVDVVFLMTELVLDGRDFPHGRVATEIEETLHILSLVILCVFGAEILGHIIAFGLHYLKRAINLFDATVVFVATALEWTVQDGAGLLIILRFWRLIRVAHGVFAAEEAHKLTEACKHATKLDAQVQEELKSIAADVEMLLREIVEKDKAAKAIKSPSAVSLVAPESEQINTA